MNRRSPLAVIFFTVFLDLLGFGILLPFTAFYIRAYGGPGLTPAQVAAANTWLGTAYSLMQFLFAPVWGRLSDRVGRRPIILMSVTGSCLSYLLFGFARSIPMLVLSRALSGIMAANISTAQAYVADVTTPEDRTRGMGMIGAAIGLGFVFGPAIGVAVSGPSHAAQPSAAVPFLAAGLAALNLVLAFFVLPESLKPGAQAAFGRRDLGLGPILRALSHPRAGLPIILFFLSTLAFGAMEWSLTPFLMDRFRFEQKQIGELFFFLGILIALVQGGLVRRLAKGDREPQMLVAGTLLMIPGLTLIAATHSTAGLWGVLAVLALGQGITSPAVSSLVSKSTDPGEQGAMLGVSQGMSSLARAVGPLAAGALIGATHNPAAPFPAGGIVMALAFLLSLRVMAAARRGAREEG
jgi:DHA1 family tetracycline resistance protein-like MFS transporter